MTNKFRASYSVLNTWASGDWERAIKMYFKLEKFTTRAMAEGKEFHEAWEAHINKYKTLPNEFDETVLKDPKPELKLVVQIYDWLELVGVIDCLDVPAIYEFKTGKTTSEIYAVSKQPAVYGVLATMSGFVVDRAFIYHYDQYKKQTDMSQVWLTDKTLQMGINWIETLASEMHDYLVENKLYERFGAKV